MLSYIFSTEERIRILYEVLFRRESTVNQISLSANVNKGLVSIFIRRLIDFKILQKKGRIISPVESSFTKQIKILLNIEKIRNLEIHGIKGMGLFGSWADGTNFQDSDIDMWLKLEKEDPVLIGTLIRKISRATGKEPDLLILTEDRWNNIKQNDKPFFKKIKTNNITVLGENLE